MKVSSTAVHPNLSGSSHDRGMRERCKQQRAAAATFPLRVSLGRRVFSGHFGKIVWKKGVGLIEHWSGYGAMKGGFRLKRKI
jgi:hypothetical protein